MPSSNQRIATLSGPKLVFLIRVGGLNQWMRLASSAQKRSGSFTEASYFDL